MRVLLLSMPDSSEHTPSIAVRMPNGALGSLAGNLDPHHTVAIADLVLVQSSVRPTIERLVRDCNPDVVGLSVMTFQRESARRVIALVRALKPDVRVVVGGYDPSLAPEAWTAPEIGVDAIVRGEGETTFGELLRAYEADRPLDGIAGLWFREGGVMHRNPPRAIARIEDGAMRLPNRSARVLSGYTMLGRQVDVVETSRGCTFDCSFCSIIEMRGRNFHRYPIARVISDIEDARAHGARTIFFVDDNITLDVRRFVDLCRAIVGAGLDRLDYMVQAMTASIAAHGEELAPLMKRAGFRYVFLGIENVIDEDLHFLKANAKNSRQRDGVRTNTSVAAVDLLRRHGMFVVGGLIVGNPDDRPEAIEANLAFARRYVDWPYIQHPTPYPGTPMTQDFIARDLLVNRRVEDYDGTTAVTRSEHLEPEEIEFLRWKAERWMKVRHMRAAFVHDPGFVARHALGMLAHTFRGTTWRSALGLESPRKAFARFRALRARERQYVDWPDPLPAVRRTVSAALLLLAFAATASAQTLFTTGDFRRDGDRWTDPAYYRYNTARQLTDMQVDNRFGEDGSKADVHTIRSPYPFKTSWEHYQAWLQKAAGGAAHSLATLPDWDGQWRAGGSWLDGRDIQASTIAAALTPQYREYYVQQVKAEAEGRHWWAASFCLPDGFIRGVQRAQQFIVRPGQVVIVSDMLVANQIRWIFTDGRGHLPEREQFPQWQGESIGFWDGNALVVHTNQIKQWNATHSMFEWSDRMTAVERYERKGDVIEAEMTLYDPIAFLEPLHVRLSYGRAPGTARPVYSTCTDTNGPSSNVFVRSDGVLDERVPGDPGYWDPTDPRPWASHYAIGERASGAGRREP